MNKIDTPQIGTDIVAEVHGHVGLITLSRPQALNALSLPMIRALTASLVEWQNDPKIYAVAIRGTSKTGPFGGFCAGGDVRFFHQAALAGDQQLDEFFTEEYALNHLIHEYSKPYIAFMDGIVMGGGMGISQGASVRIVTERTKMAMPETNIGLFPDVGGGYFLSRCTGHHGEWLALTGEVLGATQALGLGLADVYFDSSRLSSAWSALASTDFRRAGALDQWLALFYKPEPEYSNRASTRIDQYFGLDSVNEILKALDSDPSEWAAHTAATLRRRSPLMLHVVLEQIRRARDMTLAEDLRLERDMVQHCFYTKHLGRTGVTSETVEGIRALAVDKDHTPKWNPARIEDVTPDMVKPFFVSPWTPETHPLRNLA